MSDEEITLKVATITDAGPVLDLLRQINQETNVVMIPQLSSLSVADEEMSLAEIDQRSDCFVLLAMLGKQPVGIVTVTKLNGSANAGELGVAVLKQFWNQGIGSLLVDEAIYWYENFSTLEHLVLDVFADNPRAIHLYEKFAFTQTDQTKEQDANGQERPAILMEYGGSDS
ncbi:GNAT family N-acetyltransferase [Limosilactobacillus caecicola]|uniref:GNAT family N-acetyltransferase n=1 Tax=Limosilactobacillus caecicola TaxID=2941332 RepID=UPI00203D4A1B|nr:GNAT family N-acetyltransferase [Limosilactobacillus caecicola]